MEEEEGDPVKITLAKYGSSAVDITQYLSDEEKIRLTQESERGAFERVVDDIRFAFSDMDGYFSGLFLNMAYDDRWLITIYENDRVIFPGEIDNESIHVGLRDLWCTFDAFHVNRTFWQVAEDTKIMPRRKTGEADRIYVTLQYILERELSGLYREANPFEGIFSGFDLGDFASRPIRFSKIISYRGSARTIYTDTTIAESGGIDFASYGLTKYNVWGLWVTAYYVPGGSNPPMPLYGRIVTLDDATDIITIEKWIGNGIAGIYRPTNLTSYTIGLNPSLGVEGRYTKLHRDTTIADLLKAFATYYNAEFFIDTDSGKLKMQKRGGIVTDRATTEGLDIDTVIRDDVEPDVRFLAEERYDWIKYEIGEPSIPQPMILTINEGQSPHLIVMPRHTYKYCLTLQFENVETRPGNIEYFVIPSGVSDITVDLHIPSSGIPGVVKRKLYRTDIIDPDQLFRLLAEIDGDASTTYTDTTPYIFHADDPNLIANTLYPPDERLNIGIWIRFNENTGLWENPIYDIMDSENAPTGKILDDITPSLKFYEEGSSRDEVQDHRLYVVKLFGSEVYGEVFREQWRREFLTKREIVAGVKGINFRRGDSILSSSKLFPNDRTPDERYVMKKIVSNLNDDESLLTMISV